MDQFFKKHQENIVLIIGVILISLLSFAVGFITAQRKEKEPLKIEYLQNYFYGKEKSESSYCRSGDLRSLFS